MQLELGGWHATRSWHLKAWWWMLADVSLGISSTLVTQLGSAKASLLLWQLLYRRSNERENSDPSTPFLNCKTIGCPNPPVLWHSLPKPQYCSLHYYYHQIRCLVLCTQLHNICASPKWFLEVVRRILLSRGCFISHFFSAVPPISISLTLVSSFPFPSLPQPPSPLLH